MVRSQPRQLREICRHPPLRISRPPLRVRIERLLPVLRGQVAEMALRHQLRRLRALLLMREELVFILAGCRTSDNFRLCRRIFLLLLRTAVRVSHLVHAGAVAIDPREVRTTCLRPRQRVDSRLLAQHPRVAVCVGSAQ